MPTDDIESVEVPHITTALSDGASINLDSSESYGLDLFLATLIQPIFLLLITSVIS